MDPICQESIELLKASLMTEPILTYPDPNLPYVLFMDASKYAWACVLTQEKTHIFEGKETRILHPITYMNGLFRGSQINWACLTKGAYVSHSSVVVSKHGLYAGGPGSTPTAVTTMTTAGGDDEHVSLNH